MPANDDSISAIGLIAGAIADACLAGREVAKIHAAEAGVSGERAAKEEEGDDDKGQRRMRSRRSGNRREDGGNRGGQNEAEKSA